MGRLSLSLELKRSIHFLRSLNHPLLNSEDLFQRVAAELMDLFISSRCLMTELVTREIEKLEPLRLEISRFEAAVKRDLNNK